MNIEECIPGREVVIGMKYLPIGLGGVLCTVLDTRTAPEQPEHNPSYPHGMVQVSLPDGVEWGCKEPWIGPEDLVPVLPWMKGSEQ